MCGSGGNMAGYLSRGVVCGEVGVRRRREGVTSSNHQVSGHKISPSGVACLPVPPRPTEGAPVVSLQTSHLRVVCPTSRRPTVLPVNSAEGRCGAEASEGRLLCRKRSFSWRAPRGPCAHASATGLMLSLNELFLPHRVEIENEVDVFLHQAIASEPDKDFYYR